MARTKTPIPILVDTLKIALEENEKAGGRGIEYVIHRIARDFGNRYYKHYSSPDPAYRSWIDHPKAVRSRKESMVLGGGDETGILPLELEQMIVNVTCRAAPIILEAGCYLYQVFDDLYADITSRRWRSTRQTYFKNLDPEYKALLDEAIIIDEESYVKRVG